MNSQPLHKFFTYFFSLLFSLNAYLIVKLELTEVFTIKHYNSSIYSNIWESALLVIENLINEPLFNLIIQVFFIIIMSSWSRAAGPRARVDFLSDLTWKKILFLTVLGLLLIVVIHLFI